MSCSFRGGVITFGTTTEIEALLEMKWKRVVDLRAHIHFRKSRSDQITILRRNPNDVLVVDVPGTSDSRLGKSQRKI